MFPFFENYLYVCYGVLALMFTKYYTPRILSYFGECNIKCLSINGCVWEKIFQ